MTAIHACAVPEGSLLAAAVREGGYADAYRVALGQGATLAEWVEAFYTSPVFRLERGLIARAMDLPAGDADARALASGAASRFSAWQVQARTADELLVAAGRTRSWFRVEPAATAGSPALVFFGSAVLPRRSGGMGGAFWLLLGFHKLYSRLLIVSALRRLAW
jgi:hypothetical protein